MEAMQTLTGTPKPSAEIGNSLSCKGQFGLRGCVQIPAGALIGNLDFGLVHFSVDSCDEQTETNKTKQNIGIVSLLRKRKRVTGKNKYKK